MFGGSRKKRTAEQRAAAERLERSLAGLRGQLDDLQRMTQGLNDRLTGMDGRLSALEERFSELERIPPLSGWTGSRTRISAGGCLRRRAWIRPGM